MLADPVSPELVLVLPADQRRLMLESLAPVVDSVEVSRRSASVALQHVSAVVASRTPRLSRRRFAAALVVYTLSRAVAAVPFYVAVVVGTFLVTLVVSALG